MYEKEYRNVIYKPLIIFIYYTTEEEGDVNLTWKSFMKEV